MDNSELDRIGTIALVNLFTIGKELKRIDLIGFNPEDENHMGLINLANISANVYKYGLYVQLPFFKYLIFKLRNKKLNIHRFKKDMLSTCPSCNEFINHITEINNCSGAFAEIYNAYYKE